MKNLVNKGDEKVENWRNINEWLEEAGYKTQSSIESQLSDRLQIKFLIKKANISLERNNIIVDLNLRIVAPNPQAGSIIEDIDTNGKV